MSLVVEQGIVADKQAIEDSLYWSCVARPSIWPLKMVATYPSGRSGYARLRVYSVRHRYTHKISTQNDVIQQYCSNSSSPTLIKIPSV